MGNRKLRRELGQKLKEAGYGKLYTGNKRNAFRYLRAANLKRLLFLVSLRPGDLVNDCDGYNHRVKEIRPYRPWFGVIDFEQLIFEDGRWSCGCPYGPDKPWSPERIRNFHNLSDEEIDKMKKTGWWDDRNQRLIERIRSGEPITDEHGIYLEEEDEAKGS